MKLKKLLATVALMAASVPALFSQNVALKTNLLYDALLSPTLGIEVGLAPKWSLDVSGTLNAWTVNNKKWKQWMVQPEARYWFCQRFAGHFLALHGIGGQYNFGNLNLPFDFLGTDFRQLKDYRLQGWMAGAGVGYGYSWILDKHWNFEAEIGIGWIYTRYDKFKCKDCGYKVESDKPHNYFGPTKAALNIIYVF
ncbi:MAG: DUF3575 domain-containing protein [Muribaculaceae bacterium]|nr:DUF3575 domain-containing protein [Muribaculaceae bacterium]